MRWMFVAAAGGLWTPSNLASLRAWYDADDSSTIFDATTGGSLPSSGNDVARWEDKSGGGYHVTQGTAANCPHYVTNTLNGKPVIECTSQWLTAAAASDWTFLHDTTGSTVVAVWKAGNSSDPNAGYGLLGNSGGATINVGYIVAFDDRSAVPRNNVVLSSISRGVFGAYAVSNTSADDAHSPNVATLLGVVSDPGSGTASNRSSIRVNGGTPIANNAATNAPSSSSPTFPLQVGAVGNGVFPLTGYIAEVVICDAKLSDANREKLEGYLAHKWGLETNLPAAHPYKSSPPTV